MARKKIESAIIKDLSGAKAALAEIGGLSRELQVLEAEMNARIDGIKAEGTAQAGPLQGRIKALELGLASFAELKREELFSQKRTVDLVFGWFGFRKSTELQTFPKTTWAMVLGRLKETGKKAASAIRVKESVNREELHTWSDAELSEIGVQRVSSDRFWYEIADTEIADEAV